MISLGRMIDAIVRVAAQPAVTQVVGNLLDLVGNTL